MIDTTNPALDALVFQLGHAHPDDIDYNAAAITALRAERDKFEAAFWEAEGKLSTMTAERDAARAALERDRSIVADTINRVAEEVGGREWLLDGRGCYEWDDDKYRAEFSDALAAIRKPIDGLASIARDWSNCPTDPKEIQQARETPSAAYARGVHDAAKFIDTAGDGAVTEALSTQLCCNGHHCGCQGADVGSYLIYGIRALADAPPAPVVGVRPLQFEAGRHYGAMGRTLIAHGIFGAAEVVTGWENGKASAHCTYAVTAWLDTEEYAIAFLQADYEARILAALLPQAGGVEG